MTGGTLITDEAFRQLWAEDHTEHALVDILHCSRSTICRRAKRLDLHRYAGWTREMTAELRILRTAGTPWNDCADRIGVDLRAAKREGDRLGLPRGKRGGWEWRRSHRDAARAA